MEDVRARIWALAEGTLPDYAGWVALIQDASEEDRLFSRNLARERAQARFGKQVFFAGSSSLRITAKTTATTAASAARTGSYRATG